jgi:hypothetical protein
LRVGEHRLITLLALSLLWLGCNPTSTPPAEDAAASETPTTPAPLSPPITSECRPVDHVWDPATEPMLLPCEPTTEPCDNIDNDADGFTDPHCGSMPCLSEADCTYGGMLPDADCNHYPTPSILLGDLPGGVCNQIDGVPGDKTLEFCWGKLCPPTLKCVQGDCIPPGDGLPGAECSSGADCPLNAGCIPVEAMTIGPSIGRCKWYCHEFPCPDGFLCAHEKTIVPDTDRIQHTFECAKPSTITRDGACTTAADFEKTATLIDSAIQCPVPPNGNPAPAAVAACLVAGTGVSEGCATCYGDLISCMFNKCAAPVCEGQETTACNECLTANCTTAFKTCAGFELFEPPPPPPGA